MHGLGAWRRRVLLPGLVMAAVAPGCAVLPGDGAPGAGNGDMTDRLAAVLAGEYTNHAQVWEARRGGEPVPAEYRLTLVRLDSAPGDSVVLRLRQYLADDAGRPVRDVRLVFSPDGNGAVTQVVQSERDGAWRTLDGCGVRWVETAEGFRGATQGDGCRFRDKRDDSVVTLRREWSVGPDGLRLVEHREGSGRRATENLTFLPVRWYRGWAGVRPRGETGQGSGEWVVERDLRLHDGGAVRRLPEAGGRAHAVRLERLVWPNSGIRMLRLSVLDAETGDVVAYAWAPPGADSLGIHIGWLQAGLRAAGAAGPGADASTPRGEGK